MNRNLLVQLYQDLLGIYQSDGYALITTHMLLKKGLFIMIAICISVISPRRGSLFMVFRLRNNLLNS